MTGIPAPAVGEFVRWRKPGPVILQIERVGPQAFAEDGWWVQAGGLRFIVIRAPEDGIEWERMEPVPPPWERKGGKP